MSDTCGSCVVNKDGPTSTNCGGFLKSGKWHKQLSNVSLAELSRFENVQNELTCSDTVLLESNRLVIPTDALLKSPMKDIWES